MRGGGKDEKRGNGRCYNSAWEYSMVNVGVGGGKGIISEGSFEIILFADYIVLGTGRGSQGCYCL